MSDQTSVQEIATRLAVPFEDHEIKYKPQTISGNRALCVFFVDARTIMDRLDDVLGIFGWQDSYQILEGGIMLCSLSVRVGDEWITKQDVGGPSEQPDGGDREKAAVSEALKRAAVKFGVGRYLYRAKLQWLDYDPQKRQFTQRPILPAARPANVRTASATRTNGAAVVVAPVATPASKEQDNRTLFQRVVDSEVFLISKGLCQKGDLFKHLGGTTCEQYGCELVKELPEDALETVKAEIESFRDQQKKQPAA